MDTTSNASAESSTLTTSDAIKIVVVESAKIAAISALQVVGTYAVLAGAGLTVQIVQNQKAKRLAKKAAKQTTPEND